ncbi:MAG TPA: class I SAM-dependent methyltransferase [Aestuariivirgaceae bacterium]
MTADVNRSWTQFWDTNHSVYVSPRHLDSHYRRIADDIIRVLPEGTPRVLDHGCGEALHAGRVAERCAGLILCEAAPTVRRRLAERFAGEPRIEVIAPDGVEALPESSLDLIVANSLVQYLSPDELKALLPSWRRALKPAGRLIIADIITPAQTAVADATALLRFAAKNGFLIDAFKGLVRTFFSDYRRLRTQLGLTRYAEADLVSLLSQCGLGATRLEPNFGYDSGRIAVVATKRP